MSRNDGNESSLHCLNNLSSKINILSLFPLSFPAAQTEGGDRLKLTDKGTFRRKTGWKWRTLSDRLHAPWRLCATASKTQNWRCVEEQPVVANTKRCSEAQNKLESGSSFLSYDRERWQMSKQAVQTDKNLLRSDNDQQSQEELRKLSPSTKKIRMVTDERNHLTVGETLFICIRNNCSSWRQWSFSGREEPAARGAHVCWLMTGGRWHWGSFSLCRLDTSNYCRRGKRSGRAANEMIVHYRLAVFSAVIMNLMNTHGVRVYRLLYLCVSLWGSDFFPNLMNVCVFSRCVLQQCVHSDLESAATSRRRPVSWGVRSGHEGPKQHRIQGNQRQM